MHFTGDTVKVEDLVALCPVEPTVTFRKGEPRSMRPNARSCATSGISFCVSDARFEAFERQKADAIAFLAKHAAALAKLSDLPGLEHASIDFGIAMRNVVAQSDGFDSELIRLLAPLRLELVLSQYPVGRKMKRVKEFRRALRKHSA